MADTPFWGFGKYTTGDSWEYNTEWEMVDAEGIRARALADRPSATGLSDGRWWLDEHGRFSVTSGGDWIQASLGSPGNQIPAIHAMAGEFDQIAGGVTGGESLTSFVGDNLSLSGGNLSAPVDSVNGQTGAVNIDDDARAAVDGSNIDIAGNADTVDGQHWADVQSWVSNNFNDYTFSENYGDLSGIPSRFDPQDHGNERHSSTFATEPWVSNNFNDYSDSDARAAVDGSDISVGTLDVNGDANFNDNHINNATMFPVYTGGSNGLIFGPFMNDFAYIDKRSSSTITTTGASGDVSNLFDADVLNGSVAFEQGGTIEIIGGLGNPYLDGFGIVSAWSGSGLRAYTLEVRDDETGDWRTVKSDSGISDYSPVIRSGESGFDGVRITFDNGGMSDGGASISQLFLWNRKTNDYYGHALTKDGGEVYGDLDIANQLSEGGDRVATRTWANSQFNDYTFSESYGDLTGRSHGNEDHSADFATTGQLFSGSWNDLTDTPATFNPQLHGNESHSGAYITESYASSNYNYYTFSESYGDLTGRSHGNEDHSVDYLDTAGGTMTGALTMDANSIWKPGYPPTIQFDPTGSGTAVNALVSFEDATDGSLDGYFGWVSGDESLRFSNLAGPTQMDIGTEGATFGGDVTAEGDIMGNGEFKLGFLDFTEEAAIPGDGMKIKFSPFGNGTTWFGAHHNDSELNTDRALGFSGGRDGRPSVYFSGSNGSMWTDGNITADGAITAGGTATFESGVIVNSGNLTVSGSVSAGGLSQFESLSIYGSTANIQGNPIVTVKSTTSDTATLDIDGEEYTLTK